jgi:agmatinase
MPPASPASTRPRTLLPNPRVSPRFAGIATFCRYPRLEDVLPENRPIDWLLYGVPHDAGVTYRPGARFAPRAIREASQYVKRYHLEHKVDVCDRLSLADAGDAPVQPYDLKDTLDTVAAWATKTARAAGSSREPAKLLAVGGDHSIAYANLQATWALQGKPKGGLALIHFDSHLDTVDAVWGQQWGHASPFRRAIEAGIVNPRKMLSVGIKGPLNTADDLAFAKQQGVKIMTYADLHKKGTLDASPLRAFVKQLKQTPAYVTFDIDVVDPAFAPGTGTPCPGGLTSGEALDLLRALKGTNIVGADVVEVLPDRDPAGITAFLAAHVMFEVLALSV